MKVMKNDVIGFAVYLLTSVLFSPSTALILLAMKENADRCHYYNGNWNKKDLILGCVFVAIGALIRYGLCKLIH